MHKSGTYNSWKGMLRRCFAPNDKRFKDYGGRGITVCDDWRVFENFLADMGPRPDHSYSLDRKDVNGNYEPSNCRWVIRKVNDRNKRETIYIEFRGVRKPLIDWCELLGKPYDTVIQRIKTGWSHEEALSTPIGKYVRRTE
jgi:hypothetical protein